MTTIDQRILIPAPPTVVWEYLSRLDNNPTWQVNCEHIIFLSQRRTGAGARWRETHTSRQEYVYEISTWYDTLGYEYEFIDGPNIQSSKGRIRLQEIPEGTIVQWTYIYEAAGVLGGIRNALTTQRRLEADMVESLKNLWKIVKRTGSMEGYEARSLMRDGPQSPQERASYQSRYTEDLARAAHEDTAADLYTRLQNEEPPISTEDTRPGKAATATHLPATDEEPAEVAGSPEKTAEENRFAPPPHITTGTHAAVQIPPEQEEREPVTESQYAPPSTATSQPIMDAPIPVEPTIPAPSTEPAPATETPIEPAPVAALPEAAASPTGDATTLEPKVPSGKDTSEMSIWEVFGIPSPTDSQRMRAISVGEEAQREYEAETSEPTAVPDPVIETQTTSEEDATLPAHDPLA
ncbi:MAG: SRPBCC family protein, partial [Chloroflexota bacterium]